MSDEVDALVEAAMGLTPYQLASQRRSYNPEYRAKHAERMRKLNARPVWRANNAEAMRKRAADPVYRAKNAEAMHKMNNDQAFRANQVEATRTKLSVPVIQIESRLVHMGPSNCGYDRSHVTAVCTGRAKSAYGYHWRYATPEEVAYFWAERERTKTDGPFPLTDCPDSAKIPQEDQ